MSMEKAFDACCYFCAYLTLYSLDQTFKTMKVQKVIVNASNYACALLSSYTGDL